MVRCLFCLLAFAAFAVGAEPSRPNVVFILADDLGINDLGCYGRKEHHTPNLDRLATEGVRFTSAYCAQPICSPARAAILTGKTPARLKITSFIPGRPDTPSQKLLQAPMEMQLPLAEKTIAEYLKAAGYATACVGKWHLGGAGFGPKEQGFDFVHAGTANTPAGKGELDLTQKAIEFIEKNADKPFYLHLCHNTPHVPLAAKPELIEKYRNTFNPTYAAMMHSMDETVGMLLKKLDELKLTENTIVIFTSDNGGLHVPELKDDAPTHNTPFRAGKGFLYEGGLRIPAIIRWPKALKKGQVSDVAITQTDWLPTILEACGTELDRNLGSYSIFDLLKGRYAHERPLAWHFPHYTNQGGRPAGAYRKGKWKLIQHFEDSSLELYDLYSDPGEEKNLAMSHPEQAKSMKDILYTWQNMVSSVDNEPNPKFEPSLHKKLYEDVDVTKLKPAKTAAEITPKLKAWREAMDAVVPRKEAKKK